MGEEMITTGECKLFPTKLGFPDKDAALTFAFRLMFSPRPPTDTNSLYVYRCPSCGLVHLTKKYQDANCEAVYGIAG
jgi:hypothetical protein